MAQNQASEQQLPANQNPLPGQVQAAPATLPSEYKWQYWLNVALVSLSVLSVICTVVVSFSGDFFGLSEVQWHWVLAFSAIVTALNTAFNHTPQVTQWPSKAATQLGAKNG